MMSETDKTKMTVQALATKIFCGFLCVDAGHGSNWCYKPSAKKFAVNTTGIIERNAQIYNYLEDKEMDNENMNNGTQGQPVNAGAEQTAQAAQSAPQQVPNNGVTAPAPQTEQKDGWWKRNWKKVAGAAAGVVTIVGSAITAYNKGKAAGASMQQPMQNGYDPSEYGLNPNVEE